jgi:predicted RNase H-related nuclease YkuK (DUF458 family)
MEWQSKWMSPSDGRIRDFNEIISFIRDNKEYSIYVGCDSHSAKGTQSKYLFAIVICLISTDRSKSGNKYFYSRGVHKRTFSSLQARLTEEVAFSAKIAIDINKIFPNKIITLHADSSNDSKNKSAQFTEMFRRWAMGIGCKFASKPNAWASTSIADKHSK